MAGTINYSYPLRMPEELKNRADVAADMDGPKESKDTAKLIRYSMTAYIECAEALGRRPHSLLEFANWLADREVRAGLDGKRDK